jgi:hypothetical protein
VGLRFVAVSFDTPDPVGQATFWAELLGRDVVTEPGGAFVPGDDTQVGLRFAAAAASPPRPHRLHLHLTSSSPDDQRHTVENVLRLGGRHVDVGQSPAEGHVVLADPAGYELCVIEPGNRYLAGTGYFGEVACDGTRDVGSFWRDALGWPLVWDRGEETAIQSPLGGTKLSWGGFHVTRLGREHVRFDLAAVDVTSEVEKLVERGATVIGDRQDVVELTDVDGDPFTISPD